MPAHLEEEEGVEQGREKGRSTFLGEADNRRDHGGHSGTCQATVAPSQARPRRAPQRPARHNMPLDITRASLEHLSVCSNGGDCNPRRREGVEDEQKETNPSDQRG
jgi:hypothetical protein